MKTIQLIKYIAESYGDFTWVSFNHNGLMNDTTPMDAIAFLTSEPLHINWRINTTLEPGVLNVYQD